MEVRPTVGSEQVAHLKTVNCSCPAGQKVSAECFLFGVLCGFGNRGVILCK